MTSLQPHRLAPLPARLLAGEDDQVLGVAAGAGGQVVELEQRVELLGVLLLALQLVEDLELAVHEALVAVRDVEEDPVHALAGLASPSPRPRPPCTGRR